MSKYVFAVSLVAIVVLWWNTRNQTRPAFRNRPTADQLRIQQTRRDRRLRRSIAREEARASDMKRKQAAEQSAATPARPAATPESLRDTEKLFRTTLEGIIGVLETRGPMTSRELTDYWLSNSPRARARALAAPASFMRGYRLAVFSQVERAAIKGMRLGLIEVAESGAWAVSSHWRERLSEMDRTR